RHLTDADLVLPVGRVGFDPILGYSGPWSLIFPGLSDLATMQTHRSRFRAADDADEKKRNRADRDETFEVSWLLGSQFHVGVVAAARGLIEVVAGREASVFERGVALLDEQWTFRPDSRAEIVVAGVGQPGSLTSLESLAEGLATATRLVQHGGKIILLSQ